MQLQSNRGRDRPPRGYLAFAASARPRGVAKCSVANNIQTSPTPVDHAYRVAYRIAHKLLRTYWAVRRPHKGGTLVAIWHQGQVLIVKNTYRKEHTLPGGYPRPGETPAETGARELEEECGIHVRPDQVHQVYRGEHLFEGREDDVTIVEIELETRPTIHIDYREIAYARLAPPEEVLRMLIVPHLREYLEQRAARQTAGAAGQGQ